jgi:hypothetical protein
MPSNEIIVLDTPDQIQAFALLQLYYKLKMVAEHPNGPRWSQSPLPTAWRILADNGIHVTRRYKTVFPAYEKLLKDAGILSDKGA